MAKKSTKSSGGRGKGNPYRDAKGRFASAPGGGAKSKKSGAKPGNKKKTYAAPALSQTDQPKGLKTKRSLAAKAAAAKRKAAAQQASAQLAASRDALSQRAAAAKLRAKELKAARAKAAKDKNKPQHNIIPFIRNPQTGHLGLDAIVTAAGFLARGYKPRGADLRATLAKNKRQQRRGKVQSKVAKNLGNPAKNFAKPKSPGLRSQAQRAKQQSKARSATDRAKLKSLPNPNPKKAQNNRTPATLSRDAKLIKGARKAKNNINPLVRNPKTGDRGLDKLLTETAFLIRKSDRDVFKDFEKSRAKLNRTLRRNGIKLKILKNRLERRGRSFDKAKPPGKRSETKRAKQQAKARKNKPANLIGLAKSGKGANRVKSFHRPSVTPPFGHTRIPVRKLMKRSVTQAKLRTKATKGLLKKGQGIIQSVTTRPRNPKKRKRKE